MARLRSIRHRLRRFRDAGARRRALLIEAALLLLAARLALVAIPFPRLAARWGEFVDPGDPRASRAPARHEADARLAADVSWAVTRAARHVPFAAVCLPQAMAARVMLKRRGIASVLHFGAAKGSAKPLDTHAWLDAAGVEVTGYPAAGEFAEIACFV